MATPETQQVTNSKPRPKKNVNKSGKKTATQIAAEKRAANPKQYEPKLNCFGGKAPRKVDTNYCVQGCVVL